MTEEGPDLLRKSSDIMTNEGRPSSRSLERLLGFSISRLDERKKKCLETL